ncbi:Arp complex subunit [Rhodotorula kratochvilovae]
MGVDLEPDNLYLRQTLTDKYSRPTSLDQSFVDFDSVRYHLSTPDRKSLLVLSMDVPCWAELKAYGARDILDREYGARLLPEDRTEDGFSVTLEVDLEQGPPEGEERTAFINSVALLKRNALAAPFERAFALQREMEQSPVEDGAKDPRGEVMSAIYLLPSSDRVTVIFSTIFKEETDRILGKVFLQEFVDARRRPSCQTAPQVLYSNREPPLEIRHLQGLDMTERAGYVTFVLFPRHFTPQAYASTITQIQLFRDFLHYNIKCAKAYLHSRLRQRTTSFIKVLNRAKPEQEGEADRKTASGRTFVRA